jgi:hypothetical protein
LPKKDPLGFGLSGNSRCSQRKLEALHQVAAALFCDTSGFIAQEPSDRVFVAE